MKTQHIKKWSTLALFIVILISFSYLLLKTYQNNNASQIRMQDNQIKQKSLIIGTSITEPFVYYNQEKQLVGYDIDFINQIAQELNVTINIVEMPFANLIPAIQENKVDLVIAAMHITPQRQQKITFTQPYLQTGLVMVYNQENQQINQIKDLNGKKVGVKTGATGDIYAQNLQEQGNNIEIVEFKNTIDSFLDLGVGRIDVLFNDYYNSQYLIEQSFKGFSIVRDKNNQILFLNQVGLGIATNQNNQDLISQINQIIDQLNYYDNLQVQNSNTIFEK